MSPFLKSDFDARKVKISKKRSGVTVTISFQGSRRLDEQLKTNKIVNFQ